MGVVDHYDRRLLIPESVRDRSEVATRQKQCVPTAMMDQMVEEEGLARPGLAGEDAITLRRFEPGNVLVAAHWLELPAEADEYAAQPREPTGCP